LPDVLKSFIFRLRYAVALHDLSVWRDALILRIASTHIAPRGVTRDTVARRPLLRSFALDARGDSA